MKKAIRDVPVFGINGDFVIGEIGCGSKALVLGVTDKGTIVAYILGIVKEEHSGWLVKEKEWDKKVDERNRLLYLAKEAIGSVSKDFFEKYMSKHNSYGGYWRVDKEKIKAGDMVFDRNGKCIGVYMGDGCVVFEDEFGQINRKSVDMIRNVSFNRPLHSSFDEEEVVYRGRIRRAKSGFVGDNVRKVQIELNKQGFYSSKANGRYNAKTSRAVKKFQKSKGIKADGSVEYATWKLLLGR